MRLRGIDIPRDIPAYAIARNRYTERHSCLRLKSNKDTIPFFYEFQQGKLAFPKMSSLVYVLICIVSNSLLCASTSFDNNPLCKHDCRLSKMHEAATVLPCNFEEVDMRFCSEVSNTAQQTKDLVQECWNTEKSEMMISWQPGGGSLNEFFLHVTKTELDQGDIVMTKFCFRLYRSDPGQGTWSWAFTITTHCLSLHLSYTMVKVQLLSKDGESELWEEFIYEPDTMCSTPSICNPWASDVRLVHHGASGTVSVNVTKNDDVIEVFLILKEIKCNTGNNYKRTDKMKCEDEFCTAWLMDIPTGIYRLEVIPTCDEICEDLQACRPLYKEFALFSTSEGSACSSHPSTVSTEVQTSQKVRLPISSNWTGVVVVSLVVFLTVTVTMVGLIMRWRRNVHIRQDAPLLEEEAVLREALIRQENNHILNHI